MSSLLTEEVTVDLVDGVVTTLEQRVHKAYDADNQLVTDILVQYDSVTGVTEESKTIYLYPQVSRSVISPPSLCRSTYIWRKQQIQLQTCQERISHSASNGQSQ